MPHVPSCQGCLLAYVLRTIKLFKGVSLQLCDESLVLTPAIAEKLLITHAQRTLVSDKIFHPSKQLDLFVDDQGL